MTITFIAHSTPEPALYGAMAAILAELRALPLCHFPVSHDAQRYPECPSARHGAGTRTDQRAGVA